METVSSGPQKMSSPPDPEDRQDPRAMIVRTMYMGDKFFMCAVSDTKIRNYPHFGASETGFAKKDKQL
jgi:hypothetical protein